MGLPADYILESWKNNYYKYHCLLTNRITNCLFDDYMSNPPTNKKSPME